MRTASRDKRGVGLDNSPTTVDTCEGRPKGGGVSPRRCERVFWLAPLHLTGRPAHPGCTWTAQACQGVAQVRVSKGELFWYCAR